MSECRCPTPLRDGAHEWYCGHVGEYEYVHCKVCDKPVWMCAMAVSRCPECYKTWWEAWDKREIPRYDGTFPPHIIQGL